MLECVAKSPGKALAQPTTEEVVHGCLSTRVRKQMLEERAGKRVADDETMVEEGQREPFSLGLAAGWNLIGDPFPGTVQWSSVKVQAAGQNAPVTVAQAIQQGLLKAGLMMLSGSSYANSSTLEPWTGYWVKATRSVTLLIPPPSTAVAAAAPAPRPAWQPDQGSPPSPPLP